mgnify:FL=1
MAARKFASNFESLSNQSAVQVGAWADLGDCKQIDYGVVKGSGTITDGAMELVCRDDENHPQFTVLTLDATSLAALNTRGFQSSEPRPHGSQFAWLITTAIVGGTVTATINGQQN